MISLLRKYAANGFADFRGLAISGKIPVKQELFNEVLAEYLATATAPAPPQGDPPVVDAKTLLQFVKKAEVSADAGVLTLNFEVKV
jgi:hypothetical protein